MFRSTLVHSGERLLIKEAVSPMLPLFYIFRVLIFNERKDLMEKKIQIYDYIFILNVNNEDKIISSKFNILGRLPASLTEEENKKGHQYQQEIFEEKWNWLIFGRDVIALPLYKIKIELDHIIYDGSVRFGDGKITSDIKIICEHCNQPSCEFDCPEALKWESIEDVLSCSAKNNELKNLRKFNYAYDAVESMILAHAIAGVNVATPAYIEGIESTLDI